MTVKCKDCEHADKCAKIELIALEILSMFIMADETLPGGLSPQLAKAGMAMALDLMGGLTEPIDPEQAKAKIRVIRIRPKRKEAPGDETIH